MSLPCPFEHAIAMSLPAESFDFKQLDLLKSSFFEIFEQVSCNYLLKVNNPSILRGVHKDKLMLVKCWIFSNFSVWADGIIIFM